MLNQNIALWTHLNPILLACIILVLSTGCIRSSFVDSTYQDCLEGDQVIVNSKLFCIYQEPVNSRPLGDMDIPVNQSDSTGTPVCPEFAPYSSSYSYLTICSEEETPDDSLIEVVVAQWTEQTSDQSSEPLDLGPVSLDLNPIPTPSPSPFPGELSDL